MSRVEEERDAQRVEEARIAAQKAEAKRASERGEFAKQMQAKQTQNQQQQKNNAQGGEARQRSNARALVKGGAANNTFAKQLGTDSDRRLVKARDKSARGEAEAAARRGALAQVNEKAGDKSGGGGAGKSPAKKVGGQDDKKDSQGSRESRREQLLASHSGMAQVAPSFSLASKSASGAGASQAPLSRQMIDQIVASVKQGRTAQGMGLVIVDLKDDVLAGARLTFENTHSGVSIKVDTPDKEAGQLLSSGSTAQELNAALQGHGIALRGLEVNGKRVIG